MNDSRIFSTNVRRGVWRIGAMWTRGIYVEQDPRQAGYRLRKAMNSFTTDAVEGAKEELPRNE